MTMSVVEAVCAIELPVPEKIEGEGFAVDAVLSDLNQRIQVVDYEADDLLTMVGELEQEGRERGYGKVFIKAPLEDRPPFEEAGLSAEASISGYFAGEPAAVMSMFLEDERQHQTHRDEEERILRAIQARPADPSLSPLPPGYRMTVAVPDDAEEMAALYSTVFASYPFPITEPEYVVSTMESHVVYRILRDAAGAVVAAASAETDPEHLNAEMTDFATLPDQRGLGLAQHLLAALEGDMDDRGIPNLYTIARARSAGMNRVFYNRGYEMTGTLVNNCHIAGRFEDMHVWCRARDSEAGPAGD
jgi:putative beta-lysine N-acetyltransferase